MSLSAGKNGSLKVRFAAVFWMRNVFATNPAPRIRKNELLIRISLQIQEAKNQCLQKAFFGLLVLAVGPFTSVNM
jgi:hypothetical protein